VVRNRDGRIILPLESADTTGLGETGYRPPETATVLAADDSTRIAAVLYRPANFDPGKRYPVIDLIYGGPPFNAVPHTFGGTIFSPEASALAQTGFVVAVIDARGTPGRSRAFRDAVYGRIGEIEIADHVAGIRQLAATRPYMDTTRVGITGYSWGGYYVLHAMLTAPSIFRAGYAGAPGDFTSDAFVNEPHLGLPSEAPNAYARGDNTLLAKNLEGALKIAHGTADTNAPFSNTMRMVAALIRAGKRFELLVLPGENHALAQTRAYYRNDVRVFFVRHLGGPR
jgi:dipeptidyl aminopeptidase/acylaminoacyl peptidase